MMILVKQKQPLGGCGRPGVVVAVVVWHRPDQPWLHSMDVVRWCRGLLLRTRARRPRAAATGGVRTSTRNKSDEGTAVLAGRPAVYDERGGGATW